jgi:hypothetical protein
LDSTVGLASSGTVVAAGLARAVRGFAVADSPVAALAGVFRGERAVAIFSSLGIIKMIPG